MIDIYYITSQGKQTNEELRTLKIFHSIKTDALFTHFICECPQKWQKCTVDCRYKSVATKSTYTVSRFWRHPGRWRWQWRGTTLQSSNMGAALNSTMCRLTAALQLQIWDIYVDKNPESHDGIMAAWINLVDVTPMLYECLRSSE